MLQYNHISIPYTQDPQKPLLSDFPKDHEWGYMIPLDIYNSGQPLTDYQIMFDLYRSSGVSSGTTLYLGANCMSDFRDIRFTHSTPNAPFAQWIEGYDSTHARVWVKITMIPTGHSRIYLYYGKSDVDQISSGDATFIFFDDFLGNSLDTSKWTIVENNGISVSNSQFHVSFASGSNTFGILRTNNAYGPDIVLTLRLKTRTYFTWAGFGAADYSGTGSSIGWVYKTDYESAIYTGGIYSTYRWCPPRVETGTSTGGDIITVPPADWFIDEFAVPSGNYLKWKRNYGSSWTSATRYTGITDAKPLQFGHFRNYGPMDCDWIFIRKYAAIEPTVLSGAERVL